MGEQCCTEEVGSVLYDAVRFDTNIPAKSKDHLMVMCVTLMINRFLLLLNTYF